VTPHFASHSGGADAAAAPARTGVDLLITFANGSAALTDQARANAAVFADVMRTVAPSARFAIDGYTSAVGSRDYNARLSVERAHALTDYLVSLGVDAARFQVSGHGFDQPIDPRHPAAAVNRRVEARVIR
jgi:outer membrane protein OmpA-like peptidoglycan-associated protein